MRTQDEPRPGRFFGFSLPVGLVLLVAIGWIALEYILFSALSGLIGGFAAVLFHVAKGGVGLVLLALVVRRVGLRLSAGALKPGRIAASAGELAAGVLGAMLIAVPGILPMLAGLALFAPSVRAKIARRFTASALEDERPARPGEVELDRSEWREAK
jgi:UPF0716 family protein affecting phage T7 exclusion